MNISNSRQLRKLKDFFQQHAPECVHKPEGMLPYRYTTPSYGVVAGADDKATVAERSTTGHYLQMYDWDACFFSQAAHRVGIEGLEKDVVANFLSLKQADGQIPRTVSPGRVWDLGDQCKPFLAKTLLSQVRNKSGPKAASDAFSKGGLSAEERNELAAFSSYLTDLDCYLGYFRRQRLSKWGLYHWRNVLESGVDDNLALIAPREAAKDEDDSIARFDDGRILAVDINSYLAGEYRALALLAEACGNKALQDACEIQASELCQAIEEHLWHEKLALYCGYNTADNTIVALRSWTGLTPVIMGFAAEERAHRVIHENILNQEHFLRPAGLASHAVSEPLANQQRRGLYGRAIVSNWQGPVWVLPNALVVRALLKYGYKKEAQDIAARVVATLSTGLEDTGTLYENYNAETGAPLWAPNFMSWNILALELVELLE
ncbi:MAG: trehalase family glycosidase [Candidatus Obscuribacter sp.]|nr:trehalase family glycosidase [Candidatus Obscuribacter sp.]